MATNIVQGFEEEEGESFTKFLAGPDMCSEPMDVPGSVVLRVSWGSSWLLYVDENERGVFMEEEMWEDFVADNSLGENDFLVFTHQENLLLNVKIFKQDGVEMLSPPEHLQESDNLSDTRNCETIRARREPANILFKTKLKKRNNVLTVSAQLVKDYNLRFANTILFIDRYGELPGKTRYEGRRVFISEWYKICRRNRVKHDQEIVCELLHTRDVVHSIRVRITNGEA